MSFILLGCSKPQYGTQRVNPTKCAWDIFSDEHDVVALDGRIVHLGSWRGAGGFIADQLNRRRKAGEYCYDYLGFYMGTFTIAQRADLTPVYEMVFRRLKETLF